MALTDNIPLPIIRIAILGLVVIISYLAGKSYNKNERYILPTPIITGLVGAFLGLTLKIILPIEWTAPTENYFQSIIVGFTCGMSCTWIYEVVKNLKEHFKLDTTLFDKACGEEMGIALDCEPKPLTRSLKTGQKLVQPINNMRVTASPNNQAYKDKFGFWHYGLDCTDKNKSNLTVYASGNGEVVAKGYDNACGNVVIINYPKVYNHKTKKYEDVVFRYFHLASTKVSIGQKVTKDTVIGTYGNTGKYGGTGLHLHLEADTDILHPRHTPTITGSNFLYGTSSGANADTIVTCTEYLYTDTNQSYMTVNDQYINDVDKSIPSITEETTECVPIEEYELEVSKRKEAEQQRDEAHSVLKNINKQTDMFS